MEYAVRHPRLDAFYESKVLSALMMVIIASLCLIGYNEDAWLLPVITASLAAVLFVGYTLWFWIKKPASIVVNSRLSDLTFVFMLYCGIIVAVGVTNPWWFIAPVILEVLVFFIMLVDNSDKRVEIPVK